MSFFHLIDRGTKTTKQQLHSGKRLQKTMENLIFLMGKSTISMAMFNSFLYVYQRVDDNNRYD